MERHSQRTRLDIALLLLVVAVALAMRLTFFFEIRGTVQDEFRQLGILDMGTWDLWAKDILAGDWLGRTAIHPYHEWWQGPIAPEATWIQWYGGRSVFHQAPLYPYALAAAYALFGPGRSIAELLQLVLGALHAGLVFWLGRCLAGRSAGLIAGAAVALYGPLILYEGTLLRDGPLTWLSTLAVFAAVMLVQRRTAGWAASAGVLAGLATLAKPSGLLFVLCVAVWLAFVLRRAVLPFLLGTALALLPLAVRNVYLGVPPLKMTTRGPTAFVDGNAADAPGVGWDPPPSTGEILRRSDYRLAGTIVETLKTHADHPLRLLELQLDKTLAYLGGDEVGNNLHYAHVQRACAVLRHPPAFPHALLAALGLAGMVTTWRRRREFAPAYLFFASHSVATVGFFVVSRFRQPVIPILAVFAGAFVVEVARALHVRAWRRVAAALLLALVLVIVTLPRRSERERYNSGVFAAEAMASLRRGDLPAALATVEESARIFADDASTQGLLGSLLLSAGRPGEAVEALERAAGLAPEDANIAYALGFARLQAGDRAGARHALERALALDPEDERAARARAVLEE